jgi:hypothetical protein
MAKDSWPVALPQASGADPALADGLAGMYTGIDTSSADASVEIILTLP